MGPAALRAFHPQDAECVAAGRGMRFPFVIAMYAQACAMAAGTCKLVYLYGVHNGIIKILCKVVAVLDDYSYHSIWIEWAAG